MSGKPTYEELEQRIKTLEQAELQKRKAETALKKEKRRFQQILDSFPFGIYIVDQHYVIEYLNSRIRREFGDPATLKCHEYFHCSSDPCSWCQNEKVFQGQTLYRNSHSPQNERDYELVDIPLYNDDGTVSKLAVFNDITERKQSEAKRKKMEEELIKRNQFIETILDNLPIGLAVNYIDEGKSTYINKKFQEIYGWPEEELADIESFFQNVYPDPQYRDKIRQQVLRDIQSGDPDRMVWEGVKVTARNGMEKIVSAKNIPLFEQNLMISTVQDITERQTLQAQLQQAQKMEAIGTLAGGIAHDFNNILSVIMGYTELALDKIAKKTGPYDDLQEVFQAGLRARELVKQILTFSRQAEQKIQPVQLNLIVNETLKFLRSSLPASIEIRRNIASKARVLADPTQVHQVLMNLCGNAKHAMRQTGGVIEVELTETLLDADAVAGHPGTTAGNYLRLTVADSGEGMPAEVLEKIFDPFFTTKGKDEGTGLGLSVVHGIVKSSGGFITVSSEPGHGSTFNVFWPVIEAQARPLKDAQEPLPKGTERVLFVDDEKPLADIYKQILEHYGYEATVRTNSVEALQLFKARPDGFDLVITDMTMPHMNGLELAAAIIKMRPEIPVIVCTGFSESLTKERLRSVGVREFVMKPISKGDLLRKVRHVLDGKIEPLFRES